MRFIGPFFAVMSLFHPRLDCVRRAFFYRLLPTLHILARFAGFPDMKALLQTGSSGRLCRLKSDFLSIHPTVLNHNIETVKRLYTQVRPMADYRRSLELLEKAANHQQGGPPVKSGIMLGLGGQETEIFDVFEDLRSHGCTVLTIGQYLQPSKAHLPVERYIRPEQFDEYRKKALSMGFSRVVSGPFVRSSYHAGTMLGKGNRLS